MKKHYIIPIFVPHKGCPHDCIFCNQKRITGQFSEVNSEFVYKEIRKYLNTIPESRETVEVSFFGGSFTGLPKEEQISLLEPAKQALTEGRIDAIRLSTRPDYIDEDILDVIKKYGVSIIELGVQSMDEDVLEISNRGHGVDDVYKSSELIKKYGFTLGLQMMIGLPGDTEEKDIETARQFIRISPSMVRIYPALVIRDTYMEDLYRKGSFVPLKTDEAVDICSRLYLMFERAGIKVIRMGLQTTDNINLGRDVVSGPFHPAFRELVESKILNDMVIYMFSKQSGNLHYLSINEHLLSKLFAGGKRYFSGMLQKIAPYEVKVIVDNSLPPNAIKLHGQETSHLLSVNDYSHMI